MILVVGLGNPGKEYENTRHNMGFMTLDLLMEKHIHQEIDKKGFKGLYLKTEYKGEQVIFLKPQTYMNLSGQSVVELINFFKIKIDDIVVIYDDLDLIPGKIRLRKDGSSGGQKGIGNIIDLLGTQKIKRIRIGIGKSNIGIVDYVLGVPNEEDSKNIKLAQEKAALAILDIIENGFDHASNHFN